MPDKRPADRVFLVLLRQPTRKAKEMRSDPFWEFGSFGCTGCHRRNLMNHRNADRLTGGRLAFAQGGNEGFRLVCLTPPISVKRYRDVIEARWQPAALPFRYDRAPLLINNTCESDVPGLVDILRGGRRGTCTGQFASNCRSKSKPLPPVLAEAILDIYAAHRGRSDAEDIARTYVDALPYDPPCVDTHRQATYQALFDRQVRRRRC